MGARLAAVGAVFRSPVLLRLQLAYFAFNVGEWATWVAVVIYAYGRGGAGEAGIVAFVQLFPSIIVAPAAASLGDRYPRARVLLGTYLVQAVAMAVTTLALVGDSPLVVYALSTVTATSITLTRPVHAALLPEVVTTPEELTASNVASGAVAGAAALFGPVLAGVLVTVAGPAAVFAVTAVGAGIGALAVAPLARRSDGVDEAAEPNTADGGGSTLVALEVRGDLAAGVVAVARDRRLLAVVALLTFAAGLLGALDIFYAVLAIELLGLDDGAIGFLGAAAGLGAFVGSGIAIVLVGRERLAGPLIISAGVFGGAVAATAFAPGALGAAVLLGISGIGSALVFVSVETLTQRLAGDDVMSRVFGVEEAAMMAAQSLGALAVPVLLLVVSAPQALVIAGLALPAAAVLAAPVLIGADRSAVNHARELRLLQRVPMFAPLAAPVLERLAAESVVVEAPEDAVVITAGETGDRFYVIESGTVEAVVDGVVVRRLGPGDSFGEIALVRDVPRTATVLTRAPTVMVAIDREPFLAALTGQARSRAIAARMISDRLAAGAARPR